MQPFIVSAAIGPQMAYWLVNLFDVQSGRMWFPDLRESPSLDFVLKREAPVWRASLYACGGQTLLADVVGTPESWAALARWQNAD